MRIGAFTTLPAVLWLAGNLFRILNPAPAVSRYNPLGRLNVTLVAMLLGFTRPTRRSVAFSLLITAVALSVIGLNAHHGWNAAVEVRMSGGSQQVRYDDGTWSIVSQAIYQTARAEAVRASALAPLLGDTVMLLAMVGFYRLEVDGTGHRVHVAWSRCSSAGLRSGRRIEGQAQGMTMAAGGGSLSR